MGFSAPPIDIADQKRKGQGLKGVENSRRTVMAGVVEADSRLLHNRDSPGKATFCPICVPTFGPLGHQFPLYKSLLATLALAKKSFAQSESAREVKEDR